MVAMQNSQGAMAAANEEFMNSIKKEAEFWKNQFMQLAKILNNK